MWPQLQVRSHNFLGTRHSFVCMCSVSMPLLASLTNNPKYWSFCNQILFYSLSGAWILTPGTNTGVYMMVGAAVKDHIDSTGSAAMNDIVLLGIASWGSVTERDRLEHEEV